MEQKGRCKHGEFRLGYGCEKCIAERRRQSTGDAPPTVGLTGDSLRQPSPLRDVPTFATGGTELIEFDEPFVISRASPIGTALVNIKPETDIQVQAFYNEALRAKEYAEARVIVTVEDLKPAADDLILIRQLKKAMEGKRKEYVSPLQEHVKSINDAFKTLMEPIEIADTITGGKILAFTLKQKLIREAQEKVNALRLEAARIEMETKDELSESVNLVEVIPPVSTTTRTELGSVGQRDNWKWEVIDLKLVPTDYLMINAGMLTPIVKASKGKISIAGIRIYNEPILARNTR